MNQCLRSLAYVFAFVSLALPSTEAGAKAKSSHPKKTHEAKKDSKGGKQRSAAAKQRHSKHAAAKRKSKKPHDEDVETPAKPALTGDLAALKDTIDLARRGKTDDATAARNRIAEAAGQKLAEWFILRNSETTANFNRYAASSPPIRNGRACPCSASAPRRGCGRRRAMRRPSTASPRISR